MHSPVLILTTGGTFDKVHDSFTEAFAFPNDKGLHITTLLNEARCHHPDIQTLIQKDSLDMTAADRQVILTAVMAAAHNHIVITHGTGTMAETARFLDTEMASRSVPTKTIVLTGAMRPFSLAKSDAGFNVGSAIIAAQLLPSGVYGVMNGRVFSAISLNKNTRAGRFDL